MSIPHDAVMLDPSSGVPVLFFRELLLELSESKAARLPQTEQIKKLQTAIVSQGSVVFCTHPFTSLEAVNDLVMEEDPTGKSLAVFTSPLPIGVHNRSYKPSQDWRTDTKKFNRDASLTNAECKFINACDQVCPTFYVATDCVVEPGKKISAFKSAKVWLGQGKWTATRARLRRWLPSHTLL